MEHLVILPRVVSVVDCQLCCCTCGELAAPLQMNLVQIPEVVKPDGIELRTRSVS